MTTLELLTPFEREALFHVIHRMKDPIRRQAFMRQFEALRVKKREYTGVGFFTYFDCPAELRSADLPEEGNDDPPRMGLWHPTDTEVLTFLLYTKEGALDYLEGVALGGWYEEDAVAGRWSPGGPKIEFDPALIDRPPGPVHPLRALDAFEQEVLGQIIARVDDPAKRHAMEAQVPALLSKGKDYGPTGFFLVFWCPEEHRSPLLQAEEYPEIHLLHPSGKEEMLFTLSVYRGAMWQISVFCKHALQWPKEDALALRWPNTLDPIVFDSAFIRPCLPIPTHGFH